MEEHVLCETEAIFLDGWPVCVLAALSQFDGAGALAVATVTPSSISAFILSLNFYSIQDLLTVYAPFFIDMDYRGIGANHIKMQSLD